MKYTEHEKGYYDLLKLSKFSKLNDAKELELVSYQAILFNQIYYKNRYLYVTLLEEYLKENAGIAGTSLFIYKFSDLERRIAGDNRAFEAEVLESGLSRLGNFSIDPDPASEEFFDFVEDVFGLCEEYRDREDQMSDPQFRFLIQFIL